MFKFKGYGDAKDKVMEEKMRAFVRVGFYLTDEFKELSEELMPLLREHGRTKVPLESDRSNIHAYMSAVHEGWKNAQNLVLDRLIHNFYDLELLNEDKVKFHKLKDRAQKSECIRLIELIALENLILRRYIDAIVWAVLDCEHSSIRRLPMRGGVDNLNLKSLIYIREALLPMNKDPLVIAIASDLTTFIHSGDVIRRRVGGGVEILELKKGEKNIDISKGAKFAVESQCPHFDDVFLSGFSEKDGLLKQLLSLCEKAPPEGEWVGSSDLLAALVKTVSRGNGAADGGRRCVSCAVSPNCHPARAESFWFAAQRGSAQVKSPPDLARFLLSPLSHRRWQPISGRLHPSVMSDHKCCG